MSLGTATAWLTGQLVWLIEAKDCLNLCLAYAAIQARRFTEPGFLQAGLSGPGVPVPALRKKPTVKKARCQFVSVNDLPVEILIDILQHALPDVLDHRRIQVVMKLRLVCRRWNAEIIAAATLWGVLSGRYPPHILQLVIERSQNAPVIITRGYNFTIPFLNAVTAHTHRCRVLSAEIPAESHSGEEWSLTMALLQQSFPILEELSLSRSGSAEWFQSPPQIRPLEDAETTARLKVLRLDMINWTWRPILSNLQALELSHLGITTLDFLDCLRGTRHLRSMELVQIQLIGSHPGSTAQPLQPVTLQSLLHLRVDGESSRQILSYIVPSSLQRLQLCTPEWGQEGLLADPPLRGAEHHYVDLIRSIAVVQKALVTLEVKENEERISITHSDESQDLEVTICRNGFSNTNYRENFLRWTASTLNHLEAHIAIWLGHQASGRVSDGDPRLCLDRGLVLQLTSFKRVKELRIGTRIMNAHHLYRRMAAPVFEEMGRKSWVFPKLTNLQVLGNATFQADLLAMVEERCKPSNTQQTDHGELASPPAAIKTLKIRHAEGGDGYSSSLLIRLGQVVDEMVTNQLY